MPTIHQIWLGPNAPPLEWMNTWYQQHPNWSYLTRSEETIPALHNQALYDHCLREGMYDAAADVARVEILYQYGGIYVDADTECLRPLDPALGGWPFFAVEEPSIEHEYLVTNAFMGARPKSELLRQYITALSRLKPSDVRPNNCADLTGPGLLTRLLASSRAAATVLPPWYFDQTMSGEPVFGRETRDGTQDPYIRHHYSSTHAKWLIGRPEKLATRGYPGTAEPRVVVKGMPELPPCRHDFRALNEAYQRCLKCGLETRLR